MAKDFKIRVLEIVKNIPEGKTMTYKEVASLAKSPMAARVVGNILNKNYNPRIPCHRVICSSGLAGGFNRGVEVKKSLLKKEGISLD